MHHRAPFLANKHTYIVPSYRWTPYSQKIFTRLSKKSFAKNKKWKQSVTNTMRLVSPPPLFHVGCKLNIKKRHREGQFWITLSKSNVFFINFSMKIKSLLIILVTDCRPCSKIFFNLLFAVYR